MQDSFLIAGTEGTTYSIPAQIGPVLQTEQLPKKQVLCSMVNPKYSETMKLGSLAMWWSPLIIVCPDYIYLSKLFLVLQSCSSRTLNNTQVRALWLRSVVGRHRETGCMPLGRGSAQHGLTKSHGEKPS